MKTSPQFFKNVSASRGVFASQEGAANMATPEQEMNEYEAERARRIAANKERMRALGLGAGSRAFDSALAPIDPNAQRIVDPSNGAKRPRKRYERAAAARLNGGGIGASAPPARESRRLRGYRADSREIAPGDKARPVVDVDGTRHADSSLERGAVEVMEKDGAKRRGIAFPDPRRRPNSTVVAPFTLASTRVTVVSLGAIHRGPFPQNYWSSKGCIYHHPFPVGYRARKAHFGREWEMRIDAGECGPSFSVVNMTTGEVFAGETPTKPWTRVCVSLRLGTRISGPQFFGFSDPVTMRALAALCSPAELRRCLTKGEEDGDGDGDGDGDVGTGAESGVPTFTAPNDDATPLELAVAEFRTLDGVGEKTAIAIARSTAFSHLVDVDGIEPAHEGRRLRGLAELIRCVREGGAGVGEGEAFVRWWLASSPELPAATTRWPAWRVRIVPRVMDQLRGVVEIGAAGRGDRRRSGRERDEV